MSATTSYKSGKSTTEKATVKRVIKIMKNGQKCSGKRYKRLGTTCVVMSNRYLFISKSDSFRELVQIKLTDKYPSKLAPLRHLNAPKLDISFNLGVERYSLRKIVVWNMSEQNEWEKDEWAKSPGGIRNSWSVKSDEPSYASSWNGPLPLQVLWIHKAQDWTGFSQITEQAMAHFGTKSFPRKCGRLQECRS